MVPQRSVDADKAGFADFDTAGDHDMRSNEAMVVNDRVVANVVAAPQGDVVADGDKGLNRVVFEDKAVVAYPAFIQNGRARTDICGKPVAQGLCGEIFLFANLVKLGIAQRDKHFMRIG